MTRFIQLTDMHTGLEDEFPLGVDLRSNFQNALAEIQKKKPDYLFLTGDFCLKGGVSEIYAWQQEKLLKLGIPLLPIPGNHDDKTLLSHYYDLFIHQKTKEVFYTREIAGKKCIFLDTAVGETSDYQKSWLTEELYSTNTSVFVFMHHPPMFAGVPHMDENYFLRDHPEVLDILRSHNHHCYVFCGHYHTDRTIIEDNVIVHITPSLYLQIADESAEFSIHTDRPGFRIIDVYDNGRINTQVNYIEPTRK